MVLKKIITVSVFVVFATIIIVNILDFSRETNQEMTLKQLYNHPKLQFLEIPSNHTDNDYVVDIYPNKHLFFQNESQGIIVNWRTTVLNMRHKSQVNLYLYGQNNRNKTKKVQQKLIEFVKEGQIEFKIPEEPGIYESRYIMDSNFFSLASTKPIYVFSSNISLEISQTLVSNQLEISWDLGQEQLRKSSKNTQVQETYLCLNIIGHYDECVWSSPIVKSTGLIKAEMPSFAGIFVMRIMQKLQTWKVDPQHKCLQISKLFKLENPQYKLTNLVNQTVVASSISVSWNVLKFKHLDWIGLFSLAQNQALLGSETPLVRLRVTSNTGKWDTIIPPNSNSGPFIFVYFSDHRPVAVSDIIFAHQPNVKCPAQKTTTTPIKHIVIIVVENHSFDSYFGSYCKAQTYSNPSCNDGNQCCEAAPEYLEGYERYDLTNKENMRYDPNHNMDCELCEINGRRMDGYIKGCFCSDKRNFAFADKRVVQILYDFAKNGSLADNYFQASAGATSQNNMYLARASFVFPDCTVVALGSAGDNCYFKQQDLDKMKVFYDPSLTTILDKCDVVLKTYAEGFASASKDWYNNPCWPNGFNSGDIPHIYYAGVTQNPKHIADYLELEEDIKNKRLPDVSYIKPLGIRTGHPEAGNITAEVDFVNRTVNMILNSDYYEDTLILYTADETGGFYDHKIPPPTSKIDNVPYGPRISMLAIGKFAKKDYISHDVMEHSSFVKFVEYNYLGGETGQLNTRDKEVNNMLDMFDLEISDD